MNNHIIISTIEKQYMIHELERNLPPSIQSNSNLIDKKKLKQFHILKSEFYYQILKQFHNNFHTNFPNKIYEHIHKIRHHTYAS